MGFTSFCIVASTFVGNALGAGVSLGQGVNAVSQVSVTEACTTCCMRHLWVCDAACATHKQSAPSACHTRLRAPGDALQAKTSALAAILTAPLIWILVAAALVEPHAQAALIHLFTDGRDPKLIVSGGKEHPAL